MADDEGITRRTLLLGGTGLVAGLVVGDMASSEDLATVGPVGPGGDDGGGSSGGSNYSSTLLIPSGMVVSGWGQSIELIDWEQGGVLEWDAGETINFE
ncbi:hypothetical protein [Halosimplex halobium]|uniref:hypothetical protein n=1 Tax=Halosimplex halobium TaxID=3396618 RepID=UPI003F55F41B